MPVPLNVGFAGLAGDLDLKECFPKSALVACTGKPDAPAFPLDGIGFLAGNLSISAGGTTRSWIAGRVRASLESPGGSALIHSLLLPTLHLELFGPPLQFFFCFCFLVLCQRQASLSRSAGDAEMDVLHGVRRTHSGDNILNLLLVRFTFKDVSNLLQTRVLLITERDNLVERTEQLKRVGQDSRFRHGRSQRGDQANDERQSGNVLQGIA
jgi:hypothetical protein